MSKYKREGVNKWICLQAQVSSKISTKAAHGLNSGHNKEEHMIIAHRLAAMEKRRVGTRFLDHEVTEADLQKPLIITVQEKCDIM